MADSIMKFYSTVASRLNELEVKNGQLIFVNDVRKIYLDTNNTRVEYSQIILLVSEEQRESILAPLNGFYFVQETNSLWRYNNKWIQLTLPPSEIINFLEDNETLPEEGSKGTLYILGTKIYKWDKEYVELNTPQWGTF